MKKLMIAAAMAAVVFCAPTAVLAQGDSGFKCGRGCVTVTTTPTTTPPVPTTSVPPTGTTATTVPTTQTTVQPVAPEQGNNAAPEQSTVSTTPASPAPEQHTTPKGNSKPQQTSNGASGNATPSNAEVTSAAAPEAPVAPETARLYESDILASQISRPVVTTPVAPVKSSSSMWMLYALAAVTMAAGVQVLVRAKSSRNTMVFPADIPDGMFIGEETKTVTEDVTDVLV